ncbi:uncharacterized protein LOC142181831 [Nicotiana tabacum]|uniref:Uncharacterized protein LOC142181831 n=1 Tax=Nicotiana tabacum TaxID=4097 RepID=A0AC58UPT9_TOBAC
MKVDQRHATSKFISGYIIDNLRDPRFEVTPAFVMEEMQKLHGLDIDSYQAIANGIAKVYPKSHHGICIYHLEQNLKQRKVKSEVIKLFQSATRVYRRKEFDLYMSDIAKVDKNTYDYLMEESPERWARSCSPRRRYDMLTTNIVESMNSMLLEARELSILRMMDFIQVKLQRWFYERRNEAEGTFYDISCWVFPVDSWHSRVEEEGITFLVDLNKTICDCFQFQFDELPCIHAIAAIEK